MRRVAAHRARAIRIETGRNRKRRLLLLGDGATRKQHETRRPTSSRAPICIYGLSWGLPAPMHTCMHALQPQGRLQTKLESDPINPPFKLTLR